MTTRRTVLGGLAGLCLVAGSGLGVLALTAPDQPAPTETERGGISLDRGAPPASRQHRLLGNPLWAIPLSTLTNTRERPLFTPSRRPPAPAVVAVPPPVQPIQAPVKVAQPLNLALIGTVVGNNESIGVFLDHASDRLIRLKTGESHSGWVLRSVQPQEVTLAKGDRKETLRLSRVPPPQQQRSLLPPGIILTR